MRNFATVTIAAAIALIGAAQAERKAERHVAPLRPYAPVVITFAEPKADAELDAFRQELAKTARSRIYAALARLTAAQGFFWGRDFGNRFDARKPGVDNLAAALRLEHDNGAGWDVLAALSDEAGIAPLESRPGVVCAPDAPAFDTIAFDKLIVDTRTEAADWLYPRAAETTVRAAPQPGAAVVGVLSLHFVRVISRDGEPSSHPGWVRTVMPDGKTGFVPRAALRSLDTARLCYGKDATGRWQIAGFIDRGD